jgi:Domain of unknown function (DUF4062)
MKIMATSSKIKIMLSSRCNDRFPLEGKAARTLSELRAELKKEVEAVKIFGQHIYEVWINETAAEDGSQQAWDHCMEQAKDCDVFIALFNGNAGWADKSGTIGICHAEFEKAYTSAPGKVFIVNCYEPKAKGAPAGGLHALFKNYLDRLRRFDVRAVGTERQLLGGVQRTVAQATVKMCQRGLRDASRGRSYVGPALDWSRLNYAHRVDKIKAAALDGLNQGGTAKAVNENRVQRKIDGKDVVFVVGAVPDAMSVPAAREIVGQPHLSDHTLHTTLSKIQGGPIHVVGCHKTVSEAQARSMLGFPDATVVSAPFGIYVVDPVQSIQLVLIAQCRDETSTRLGVQRFLEWLDESEQAAALVRHAGKRKNVVRALAAD